MKRLLFFFLLLFSTHSFSQKLNKETIDSLKIDLSKMLHDDQIYRIQIMYASTNFDEIRKMKNWKSILLNERFINIMQGKISLPKVTNDSLTKLAQFNDSINLEKLKTIIMKYGYLNQDMIGNLKIYDSINNKGTKASFVQFLILLHSIGKSNYDFLLPILLHQVHLGNMPPKEFASWHDRNMITVFQKKQLYGEYSTQCIENIDITNQERNKIGLKKLNKNRQCIQK